MIQRAVTVYLRDNERDEGGSHDHRFCSNFSCPLPYQKIGCILCNDCTMPFFRIATTPAEIRKRVLPRK